MPINLHPTYQLSYLEMASAPSNSQSNNSAFLDHLPGIEHKNLLRLNRHWSKLVLERRHLQRAAARNCYDTINVTPAVQSHFFYFRTVWTTRTFRLQTQIIRESSDKQIPEVSHSADR